MTRLFGVTMFLSALLLFLVQPMIGKMILPLLGGTPAVWNTCLVFFQALLLAGYTYAHLATQRLGVRRQARWHCAVLALPIAAFVVAVALAGEPVHVVRSLAPQGSAFPFFGVIALLSVTIALPFFVVAATAPLLQRWLADTDHPAAADPYFLYSASNAGSLLALGAYPVLLEPTLPLRIQGWAWAAGYVALAVLIVACVRRLLTAPTPSPNPKSARSIPRSESPDWRLRGRWLVLSMVPASLLLGVTTFATTDIAPIPLLWVIPLALYLLTFIIAFGRHPRWVRTVVTLTAPGLMLLLLFLMATAWRPPKFWMGLGPHFLGFFLAALACHLELVRLRPAGRHATEFYLWMSLGGVLGGLFNALLAPLVFRDLTEYPLAMIAACAVMPTAADEPAPTRRSRVLDLVIPAIVFVLILLLHRMPLSWSIFQKPAETFRIDSRHIWSLVTLGIPVLVVYYGVDRSLRFGLGAAAFWFAATFAGENASAETVLHRDRSYFGRLEVETESMIIRSGAIASTSGNSPIVIRSPSHRLQSGQTVEIEEVERDPSALGSWTITVLDADRFSLDGSAGGSGGGVGGQWHLLGVMHRLTHGTTLHGRQQFDPLSDEPLTYYHRTGPLGQMFRALPQLGRGEIAAVGLGTGSIAAYGTPDHVITFFEIDPTVRRIAENPSYFTYLRDAKSPIEFVMGDARLMMEQQSRPGQFALIIVDAFSSDAIPMHLLTKEAVALYLSRLREDGVIALHISNRYLDLEPVAARIAQELGLVALHNDDDQHDLPGKQVSQWIALARKPEYLAPLLHIGPIEFDGQSITPRPWTPARSTPDSPLWTDDFSNILSVLSWK